MLSKFFTNLKQSANITIRRFGNLILSSSLFTAYFIPNILSIIVTATISYLTLTFLHNIFGYKFSETKEQYEQHELVFTKKYFLASSIILLLFLWCKINYSYIINALQPFLVSIMFINNMIYLRSSSIIMKNRQITCGLRMSPLKSVSKEKVEEEKELELTHYFKK
jgi:hypothetical protein